MDRCLEPSLSRLPDVSAPQLRSDERGFTLVETIVAAVVLTVALVALAELLAVSVRMHQIGRDSASAARLAQAAWGVVSEGAEVTEGVLFRIRAIMDGET